MAKHLKPANRFARRHYEGIAETLRQCLGRTKVHSMDADAMWRVAEAIANTFAADNSRFDRKRFLAACYPDNWEKVQDIRSAMIAAE
jgi:hypothetical protein